MLDVYNVILPYTPNANLSSIHALDLYSTLLALGLCIVCPLSVFYYIVHITNKKNGEKGK